MRGSRAVPGLVALGDSITCGEGQAMLGLRCQSWAQWLAMALGLPYTCLAQNGAVASGALAEQVPRLSGRYEVGCVYLGVNDVRVGSFDVEKYRIWLGAVFERVAAHSARLLVVTIPLDLGRPPAPPERIAAANAVISELAAARRRPSAALLDLSDLAGWKLVLPDAVHLTAAGQLHVAERAAQLLGGPSPSGLAHGAEGVRPALRYALTGYAPALARDRVRRVRESAARWVD